MYGRERERKVRKQGCASSGQWWLFITTTPANLTTTHSNKYPLSWCFFPHNLCNFGGSGSRLTTQGGYTDSVQKESLQSAVARSNTIHGLITV